MNLRGSMRCSCPRKRKKRMLRQCIFYVRIILGSPGLRRVNSTHRCIVRGNALTIGLRGSAEHIYMRIKPFPRRRTDAQMITPRLTRSRNLQRCAESTLARSVTSQLRTKVYGAARAARSHVRVIDLCACRCAWFVYCAQSVALNPHWRMRAKPVVAHAHNGIRRWCGACAHGKRCTDAHSLHLRCRKR